MYIYIYIYIYQYSLYHSIISTYIHAYIHTYIHIHIHACLQMDPMYQYSLEYFKKLFNYCIDSAKKVRATYL